MQYRRHLLSSVTSESLVDKGESTFSKFLSAGQSFLLARGTFQIFRVYCIIISFSIFLKRNCCSAYQLWSVAVSSGKQRSLWFREYRLDIVISMPQVLLDVMWIAFFLLILVICDVYTLRFSFGFPLCLYCPSIVFFSWPRLLSSSWCSWKCQSRWDKEGLSLGAWVSGISCFVWLRAHWLMKSILVRLAKVKSIGKLSCFVWAMGMIQFSSRTLFVGDEISFNRFEPGRSVKNRKLVYSQLEEYFISIAL